MTRSLSDVIVEASSWAKICVSEESWGVSESLGKCRNVQLRLLQLDHQLRLILFGGVTKKLQQEIYFGEILDALAILELGPVIQSVYHSFSF